MRIKLSFCFQFPPIFASHYFLYFTLIVFYSFFIFFLFFPVFTFLLKTITPVSGLQILIPSRILLYYREASYNITMSKLVNSPFKSFPTGPEMIPTPGDKPMYIFNLQMK